MNSFGLISPYANLLCPIAIWFSLCGVVCPYAFHGRITIECEAKNPDSSIASKLLEGPLENKVDKILLKGQKAVGRFNEKARMPIFGWNDDIDSPFPIEIRGRKLRGEYYKKEGIYFDYLMDEDSEN
jgi:hypothetical protein